jgi:hypothetical protein
MLIRWVCGACLMAATKAARSPSGLAGLSEGMSVLRQVLCSFEANSGSIQRERVQKMTKIGISAVDQC